MIGCLDFILAKMKNNSNDTWDYRLDIEDCKNNWHEIVDVINNHCNNILLTTNDDKSKISIYTDNLQDIQDTQKDLESSVVWSTFKEK